MDVPGLERVLEARTGSALTDLGRPAVLMALCDGEPTIDALLEAVLASERTAAATFRQWAETAPTAETRVTYRAVAAQERTHARLVASLLDDPPESNAQRPGPLHSFLRGLESELGRAGAGLVGRPIASLQTYDRIGHYAEDVGDASMVTVIGELRADTRETVATGGALLARLGDERPPDAALDTAVYAVRLIHDDYVDTLDRLGRSFD